MTSITGWHATTLGKLGRYLNGRAFKKTEWSESGRPIIRIQNLTGSTSSVNYFDGNLDDRYVVRHGDLLVSWAATLGAYIWNGPEGALNQHIFKVDSYIDRRFHKYLLDYKLDELMQHTHGSGMVHITRGKFDGLPVSIPDQTEQRRIVEILEDHLSRLDAAAGYATAASRRLRGVRDQLIIDSITGGSVSGQRYESSLADAGTNDGVLPTLPSGWMWRRLGDVADVVGGITKDSKKQSDPAFIEVPYLRVANVQRGSLHLNEVTKIRVPPAKAEALRLRPGDVLLNEGGDRDKLARGWVWQGEIQNCIHQNHVFRARTRDSLDPYFLSWTANTIGGRWAERNGKQSVNLASISLSMIRKMPVIVPPPDVASRVIAQLHEQLKSVDRASSQIEAAQRRGSSLRRAVLAAAFTGRLTGSRKDQEVIEELADVQTSYSEKMVTA